MAKKFLQNAAQFAKKCKREYLTEDVVDIFAECFKTLIALIGFGLVIAMWVYAGILWDRPW